MPTSKMKLAATAFLGAALVGPGASAFQGQSNPQPKAARAPQPVVVSPNPPGAAPEERLAIIDKALATIRQLAEKGEGDKSDEELRWQRRRLDAQLQGGLPSAESTKSYLEALKAAEARAKKLHESGQLPLLDYLEAQYRLLEGERQAKLFSTMSGAQGMGGMGGGMGGMPAGMMGMNGMPGGQGMAGMPGMMSMGNIYNAQGAGQAAPSGNAGGPGGAGIKDEGAGGGFGGDANASPPRQPRRQHPADIERNKLIEERLDKAISMNFGTDTPLEDVLKYINGHLRGANGPGIPIYVDPVGLQNSEKTLASRRSSSIWRTSRSVRPSA